MTSSTSLTSALDNFTNRNVGENGHMQLNWSKNIEEKLVQIYFQVVRKNATVVDEFISAVELVDKKTTSGDVDITPTTTPTITHNKNMFIFYNFLLNYQYQILHYLYHHYYILKFLNYNSNHYIH